MAGVFYDADNVVTGHAMLMLTPWVKSAVVAIPADSTPLFAPANAGWGAAWVSAGATSEGFKVNVEISTTQITIEEQSTPVDTTVESKAISISAILAEDTMTAVKYAWGAGTITHTAGPPAKDVMNLTDTLTYWTIVLESRNFNGLARRLYIPKCSLLGSGEVAFRRAADKHMYPVTVSSVCATSAIQIVDYTLT